MGELKPPYPDNSFGRRVRMGVQAGSGLGQLRFSGWIRGQGGGLKIGVKIRPYRVHLILEFSRVGGDGDDRVFVGYDDAELAVSAVAAEGVVSATPELEAIALAPI
jgi:hypothetical protein